MEANARSADRAKLPRGARAGACANPAAARSGRRHHRRRGCDERPPATAAEEPPGSVGLRAFGPASWAHSLLAHEKTPSGAKAATGGRSTAR